MKGGGEINNRLFVSCRSNHIHQSRFRHIFLILTIITMKRFTFLIVVFAGFSAVSLASQVVSAKSESQASSLLCSSFYLDFSTPMMSACWKWKIRNLSAPVVGAKAVGPLILNLPWLLPGSMKTLGLEMSDRRVRQHSIGIKSLIKFVSGNDALSRTFGIIVCTRKPKSFR